MCLKTLFSRLQEFDQDIIIGNDTNENEVRGNVVNETGLFDRNIPCKRADIQTNARNILYGIARKRTMFLSRPKIGSIHYFYHHRRFNCAQVEVAVG